MGTITLRRAAGVLRQLDVSDVSTPLAELKRYLLAKYSERFALNPRIFEEIVGAVFGNCGYHVRVTSYSGDRGLDVVMFDGPGDAVVGIQVKRWHRRVEAEQIRELAGALVLNGLTRGVFVTTSGFRKGARRAAESFADRGLQITLCDAGQFYDRLQIAQRDFCAGHLDKRSSCWRVLKCAASLPIVQSVDW